MHSLIIVLMFMMVFAYFTDWFHWIVTVEEAEIRKKIIDVYGTIFKYTKTQGINRVDIDRSYGKIIDDCN